MNKSNIDVIIVTRNRYSKLTECVNKLCAGSIKPTNLVIVDASEVIKAKVRAKILALCRKNGIRLIYRKISHRGVGHSRNVGLESVKSSLFAFIDDDEYVPEFWLERVQRLFRSKKDIHVLAGPKIPSDSKNYFHKVWKSLLEKEFAYIGTIDTLPSGNSIYSTDFIKKHNLKFDERFKICSEDQAFSFELRKARAKIYFHESIWVKHDCRRDLISFVKQWFYYGVNKHLYQKLYLGSGSISEPGKIVPTLQNLKMTFPYSGNVRRISVWPGIILLNTDFLIGFLYSFFNLNKIVSY